VVTGAAVTLGQNASNSASVACPSGKLALGGGFTADGDVNVMRSTFSGTKAGWEVQAKNGAAKAGHVAAYVICAAVN
jgi:hypothetical protein